MNAHDTSGCPTGARCEVCGSSDPKSVRTAELPGGVICLTVCGRCGSAKSTPKLSGSSEARFVADHAGHLDIARKAAELAGKAPGPT